MCQYDIYIVVYEVAILANTNRMPVLTSWRMPTLTETVVFHGAHLLKTPEKFLPQTILVATYYSR